MNRLLALAYFLTAVTFTVIPQPADANSGDVSGGMAIGTSYAGVDAAPTNGLIVQGNVGIGTTSPVNTLDVYGTGLHIQSGVPSSTSMALYNNSGVLTWNGTPLAASTLSGTTNYLPVFTSSTTLGNSVIYQSSNSIGIGTTTPTIAPLQTVGETGTTAASFGTDSTGISLTTNYPTVAFNSYFNGNWKSLQSGYGAMIMDEQTAGSMLFMFSTGSVTGQGTTYTTAEKLRITRGGNVGIGTTSPVSIVDARGQMAEQSWLQIWNSASVGSLAGGDGRAAIVFGANNQSNWMFLGAENNDTSANSRFGLFSWDLSAWIWTALTNGNVGIGNTSPSNLLHVGSSSASGAVMKLQNSSGSCTHTPGSSSETVSCSSDLRLKTDVHDSSDALAYVRNIRVRDFTVKTTGEHRTGVIAQELLRDHPDMVRINSDGKYLVDQPNPWIVVKALQEQQQELEALKQKLELLSNTK